VASDPRRLRPSELCRLLNSTPLGEVINERQLYRHRTRAGFRVGDGKHVDLFRYVAWLVRVRHEPKPEREGDPYEALKERARARNAALSLAGRNVSDFKTVTSYRLVGKDQYEQVAPSGELKHGTLGEESFTNKADTYGLMLSIDRRDIINDDLGAITTVPRKFGRGSGLKINDVLWTTFMNNSAFFNGQESPTIETADADFSVLGVQMRGYHDFGVALQDHRGGVKSKGEA